MNLVTLFPPSANTLFPTNSKTGRRFKSKRYTEWCGDAHMMLRAGWLVWNRPMIKTPVRVEYVLGRPDKRVRDLANCEKALSDALVACKIIEDDSLIHELELSWGGKPGFVEITILPLQLESD